QSGDDETDEARDTQPGDIESHHPREQRGAQAERHARHGEDGAEQCRGGVLLGDEIHHDHHDERVRDAMGQDRDGRDHAGQRQPERGAATPGRRRQLAAQEVDEAGCRHRLTLRSVPCTVATADAPMRKDSSGSSTLMRTGKRAASRIQSSERSTRGNPFTLVPFSGRTAQPSPTTVPRKCRPGCDWRYTSTGAPAGMWRSCVSRKFAMTYQVPVSTSVNTSAPLRANAPIEILRLTTRPVNGARTRVYSRSSS